MQNEEGGGAALKCDLFIVFSEVLEAILAVNR